MFSCADNNFLVNRTYNKNQSYALDLFLQLVQQATLGVLDLFPHLLVDCLVVVLLIPLEGVETYR